MSFYGNRAVAAVWIALSIFQTTVAILRLERRGHDFFTLNQLIAWPIILLFWIWMGSIRWRFSPVALEQRRIDTGVRSVGYDEILAVEPISTSTSAEQFAIVYGATMFGQQQRMIIYTSNRSGFLEELERRSPRAHFKV